MADDVAHDGAPPEVSPPLSPPVEVEEPAVTETGEAAEGIAADFEAEFAPGHKLEPLPLRIRPFYLSLSHEDSRSYRGYGVVTARDWYYELPPEVHDLVDEVGFGLFCTELSRHMASRALLGALVERWWDITNSFHFSSTGEMTMTPYDFSMITGLGVEDYVAALGDDANWGKGPVPWGLGHVSIPNFTGRPSLSGLAPTEYTEGLLQLVTSLIGMVQKRETLLDLYDIQTRDSEEAVSQHFESESRGDDAGSGSGSGDDAKTGFEARNGDDETDSGLESNSHSDADGDRAHYSAHNMVRPADGIKSIKLRSGSVVETRTLYHYHREPITVSSSMFPVCYKFKYVQHAISVLKIMPLHSMLHSFNCFESGLKPLVGLSMELRHSCLMLSMITLVLWILSIGKISSGTRHRNSRGGCMGCRGRSRPWVHYFNQAVSRDPAFRFKGCVPNMAEPMTGQPFGKPLGKPLANRLGIADGKHNDLSVLMQMQRKEHINNKQSNFKECLSTLPLLIIK
ncbi:hypothetical protein HYC85_028215 [Camellia sinensis]|uniref:Aminotransferase-like plant mobile domain-containing protein n=1 Tax=Camellia sinensis TaxID=4442 RepID=A0A7J7FYJ0_CAMSI|nr:hypothetical protein HYC85_028215 [Camellia sinensis]